MKKIFSLLLTAISFTTFAQNIVVGNRPADFEYLSAPDSMGYRQPLQMPEANRSSTALLPYPIIFVHGLNSNSNIWVTTANFMNSSYGTSYGGRIDYCLNADANLSTANTISSGEVVVYTPTLIPADYYFVNFDIGSNGNFHPSGSAYVQSNQSAIAKQGLALSDAIKKVLQITGRDKVVLMGHSMGGLAAREYIQNPFLWSNGQHHVAKLVTTGTPHSGSNQITGGVLGIDCQSEAYRDLRTNYSGSDSPGVYLFGGIESNAVMNLSFCSGFYNLDVNCNGTTGENITGLNQKNTPANVDYSCIIGECTGCGGATNTGDGIVTDYSANLNNVYPGLANLFYYYGSAVVEIHTDLPAQNYHNMAGLDEPDKYSLAYHVGLDTTYIGTITPQANSSSDKDEYKLRIPTNGNLSIIVEGIIVASNFTVNLLNSSLQPIGSAFHPAGSVQDIFFTKPVSQGDYYFEIIGTPVTNSYLSPYAFMLNFSPCALPSVDFSYVTNSNNIAFSNLSQNAQSYSWVFGDGGSSTQTNPNHTYLSDGNYTVSLTATNGCGNQLMTKTITVSSCQAVVPSFIHLTQALTVQFTNTSINGSVSIWDFGDGTGSTLNSPTHTFASAGVYDISLVETNSCSSQTAFEQIFVGTTGISEIEHSIKIYPNPANSSLTIQGEAGAIEIYNSVGQLVLSFSALEESLRQINVSSLSSGLYCVRTNFGVHQFLKQ